MGIDCCAQDATAPAGPPVAMSAERVVPELGTVAGLARGRHSAGRGRHTVPGSRRWQRIAREHAEIVVADPNVVGRQLDLATRPTD